MQPQVTSLPQALTAAARRLTGVKGCSTMPDTPCRFEGPRCTQDINECVRGTSGCHPNATCTNTNGGYSCRCPPGYAGNGFNCSLDEAVHRSMLQRYTTQGPGKIACQEGQDVVYPQAAPGYAYDPIGALEQSPATKASCKGVSERASPILGCPECGNLAAWNTASCSRRLGF